VRIGCGDLEEGGKDRKELNGKICCRGKGKGLRKYTFSGRVKIEGIIYIKSLGF